MADVTLKILDPADTTSGFLSVDEAKLLLGIAPTDTSHDALLDMQILMTSATIMRLCNRMFARERLIETWRDFEQPRVFLTHYPVLEDDIETVSAGGRELTDGSWELEEGSGKIYAASGFAAPLSVTYSGGYVLPDDAPPPLKQACLRLISQMRIQATRESTAGVRMIGHKDSRVIFFDPTQVKTSTTAGANLGSGLTDVDALLMRYVRLWV
jgi:hypothetical protein